MKRIRLVHESASATLPGVEKFALQAARRLVRAQLKRRKLRAELRRVDDEIRAARRELRHVMTPLDNDQGVETRMPAPVNAPTAE